MKHIISGDFFNGENGAEDGIAFVIVTLADAIAKMFLIDAVAISL
ncbi:MULTISPECIES: hypothetical protein [unclassified Coleofasciculus]|nr:MULTISPECIES: hypothetical protein [unclassified Coleofasciculus]